MKLSLSPLLVVAVAGCGSSEKPPETPAAQATEPSPAPAPAPQEPVAAAPAPAAPTAPAEVKPAPKEFSKTLSSGDAVTGNPYGIEALLVEFIENPGQSVDKTAWFNFDRLTFKTASPDLDMEHSKEQLKNVAEILKAYPKVKLKIGGYTDNSGKKEANLKLSTARAKSVTAKLVEMGIPANRLTPEGYGDQHPECAANDTEECKAQNRRIAVRVMAK